MTNTNDTSESDRDRSEGVRADPDEVDREQVLAIGDCPECGDNSLATARVEDAVYIVSCASCDHEIRAPVVVTDGDTVVEFDADPEDYPLALTDGGVDQAGGERRNHPNHVLIEVPSGGKETADEVIGYRVGPAVNYTYFRDWRGREKLVLWGERLSESTLHELSEACHTVEREHADMAMYDAAKGADGMEGAFLFENHQDRFLHTDSGENDDVRTDGGVDQPVSDRCQFCGDEATTTVLTTARDEPPEDTPACDECADREGHDA